MRTKNKIRILQLLTILIALIFLASAIPAFTSAGPKKPPKSLRATLPTSNTDKLVDTPIYRGHVCIGVIIAVDDTNFDGEISVCDDVAILWKSPPEIHDVEVWYHVEKVTRVSTDDPLQPWNYIVKLKEVKP